MDMKDSLNAALLADCSDADFIEQSIQHVNAGRWVLVSDDEHLLPDHGKLTQIPVREYLGVQGNIRETGLLEMPGKHFEKNEKTLLIVDLSSRLSAIDDDLLIDKWSHTADKLANIMPAGLVTLYDRDLLIESQMQSVLHSHPKFIAPSGIYENPFYLPPDLQSGSVDQQLQYFLGQIVPDLKDMEFFDADGRVLARGYEAGALSSSLRINLVRPENKQWHIRCFGELNVYKEGSRVDWQLKGGAPNKTRTLFAVLLVAGERGVHVEQLGELLWPSGEDGAVKRGRLQHAVAMLRKTLGEKNFVARSGEYYRLSLPENSWMDVSAFEQACRRGLYQAKQGKEKEALKLYKSAENLYVGDLFKGLPVKYTHSDVLDWCLPRRRWLREMAIKLLRDSSVCLRAMDRTAEALDKCQKALLLDPVSESVNAELMRVYHAQGRYDAIERQYTQYISSDEMGAQNNKINTLYKNLMR